jgi:hypothetical protein
MGWGGSGLYGYDGKSFFNVTKKGQRHVKGAALAFFLTNL